MVTILKKYENDLPGGVFHCFTGNQKEAEQLLQFDKFVLGIGGVLTFKSSHLREDIPAVVPLERIVLETDSPYQSFEKDVENQPVFLPNLAFEVAKIVGIEYEDFAQKIYQNAMEFLKIG